MSQTDIYRLDGQVAVIPGGSGAIGSALGVALSGVGANVVVVGRDGDRGEAAAERIRAAGSEALVVEGDMTKKEDADRSIAETMERFGRVDIILNAIGGGAGNVLFSAEEYPIPEWDWIFDLNVRSTILPTQAAVKAMIAGGRGGRVVNISSLRGQLGIDAGYSAYVAAKGAIDSLTRQWATEWAKHGINVNAISPTFIDTPQVAMLLGDPDFKAGIVNRIPLRRVGQTDDLIGATLLFASSACGFITGQILTVDGGLTATQ